MKPFLCFSYLELTDVMTRVNLADNIEHSTQTQEHIPSQHLM